MVLNIQTKFQIENFLLLCFTFKIIMTITLNFMWSKRNTNNNALQQDAYQPLLCSPLDAIMTGLGRPPFRCRHHQMPSPPPFRGRPPLWRQAPHFRGKLPFGNRSHFRCRPLFRGRPPLEADPPPEDRLMLLKTLPFLGSVEIQAASQQDRMKIKIVCDKLYHILKICFPFHN